MTERLHSELIPLDDYADLGTDWRRLEETADGSPFLAWPWVDVWLKHLPRETSPIVFRARDEAGIAALAMLVDARERGVRRLLGRSTLMQETGDRRIDAITIEYAGLLARCGCTRACYRALFDTLAAKPSWYRLRISATTHANAIAAAIPDNLRAFSMRERPSYFVDLADVRAGGGDYLARIGSNTRSGLRRTQRDYEARGPIRVDVADSPELALRWLAELRALHQRYWRGKGKAGAFGNPDFAAFHEHLVRENTSNGFTNVVRVTAGGLVVGYLYQLVWRNGVYFYNAGLNYNALDRKRDRPGILANLAAIQKYLNDGRRVYDFLAGDDGYKRALGTHQQTMHWIQIRRPDWRLAMEQRMSRLVGRPPIGTPLSGPPGATALSRR